MAPAQELCKRLRRRDLYKEVDSNFLPAMGCSRFDQSKISPESIAACDPEALQASDLAISWNTLSFGKGDENPMSYIRFYGKNDPDTASVAVSVFAC